MDTGSTILRPRASGNKGNRKSHCKICCRNELSTVGSARNPAPHQSFLIFLIFDHKYANCTIFQKLQMRRFKCRKGYRGLNLQSQLISSFFLFEFVTSGTKAWLCECQVGKCFIAEPQLQPSFLSLVNKALALW